MVAKSLRINLIKQMDLLELMKEKYIYYYLELKNMIPCTIGLHIL